MATTLPLRRSATIWLLLSLVVLIGDQGSKAAALHWLVPYLPRPVIPGVLNLTLAFNPGAAFSFLAEQGGWQRWLFAILAGGVSVLLTRWLTQIPRQDWQTALPVALIIGGALGNLIDRLRFGQVTDFIQIYIGAWPFPSFNVADAAISVGAALLVWFGTFGRRPARGL
jgi:signal peptidase II